MNGVWWRYDVKARDGASFVTIRLSSLPVVTEPRMSATPIA